jgi:hypothetical protein
MAAQEDRGERRPRHLPARERRGLPLEQARAEAEVLDDLGRPRIEVGPAEVEPGLERGVVAVGLGVAPAVEGGGGRLELVVGGGGAGAPRQVAEQRLARAALGLLREVADGPDGADRPLVGRELAGEDAEQRRLARAVRADEAEAHALAHGDVQPVQHRLPAEPDLHALRHDPCHGRHGTGTRAGTRTADEDGTTRRGGAVRR